MRQLRYISTYSKYDCQPYSVMIVMGGKMCQNNNNNSIKWTCDYDSDIMARLEFNPNNIAALKLYLK